MALIAKSATPVAIASWRVAASQLSVGFRRSRGGAVAALAAATRRPLTQPRCSFLNVPYAPAVNSVFLGGSRSFADAVGTVEERVISAVKKYAAMRLEELKREGTSSGDGDKMVQLLSGDVSTTTKWDDLGFDDLDKVEVLLEVEEEFSHVIPDDTADAIQSVEEAIAYIKGHVS
eukprot:TRINITY_DN8845_c0_g1_i1.p2 TRINITY_DN8845_c0_g1~~TRINITY_DN8845_c0_g1_i1.p2  ORF type:complete len:192 (-),score=43.44 TRINITY_DN8845_c0_g1_i1:152-676(-)